MAEQSGEAARVLGLARSGDLAGAITAGEALLVRGPPDPALSLFIGVLCARTGDLARGLPHVRRSVALAPGNLVGRIELARMSLSAKLYDEALTLAAPDASDTTPPGREMLRIKAHALRHLDRADEARLAYESLTRADPADFESWDGLGLACLALGQAVPAVAALQNAARLQPASANYRTHLASAYFSADRFAEAVQIAREAGMHDARNAGAHFELGRALGRLEQSNEALASLATAHDLAAGDVDLLLKIGSAQADLRAFASAEAIYRALLASDRGLTKAWVALGGLLERTNRMADLGVLLQEADTAGIDPAALALVRARWLRSEDRLDEALSAAQGASEDDDPVGRSQLIGQIADRLGDTALAFSAFSDASAALALREAEGQDKAETYLQQLHAVATMLTPQWYAGWTPPEPTDARRSPLFIFGFPRSGTTLIDTMLIGHPETAVLEEEPFLFRLAERLGPVERLPRLPRAEADRLRTQYLTDIDKAVPDLGDRLIVDKNPLGIGNTLLMHRLFPDARYIFVERHPYDVVLSCFITSARLNNNVATFSSFEGIARLYDAVLKVWTRCVEVLPIAVHRARYERLIQDPEGELRPLAAFAGLEWDDRLLSHESNAAAREYIGSPSYAQVTQPLYTRAAGRWRRYRDYFGPAADILKPWVERMGYEPD